MMPRLRRYLDADWEAVLGLCLRALTPAGQALGRHLSVDLDWRACITTYLRSLTRSSERRRLVVAELRGSVVGLVHYHVDRATRSGSIGLSAVDPVRQGQGIGSLLYRHVLDLMTAEGATHATADTMDDPLQASARRAYEKAGFVAVPTVLYFMTLRQPRAQVLGRARRPPGGRKRRDRGKRT